MSLCGDHELPQDGGDGDLGWLSGCDAPLILGFEIWIEPGSDKSWLGERLPDIGSAPSAEAFAFPLSGLACNGCKASQCGSLLFHKATELRHGCDELAYADTSDAPG